MVFAITEEAAERVREIAAHMISGGCNSARLCHVVRFLAAADLISPDLSDTLCGWARPLEMGEFTLTQYNQLLP
jgi:hypothetical protein